MLRGLYHPVTAKPISSWFNGSHRSVQSDETGDVMNETPTVKRLRGLLGLYEQGFQSTHVDRAVIKLVEAEIENTEAELQRVRKKLVHYEEKYNMSSADFYARFRAGQLEADIDAVEWSVFFDLHQGIQLRLHHLRTLQA